MKTDVILTHNVVGLGAESDHVSVARGYARNYLFPQGLAIPLTAANKKQLEALKKRRIDREGKELNTMTELAATLSKLTLLVKVKTGDDGKMFGSVTAGTIADELNHQYDAHMDKRRIHLKEPIKTLGEHEVPLHLHQNVDCTLKVRVESTTPLSPEAQAAQAAKEAKGKPEARGARTDARPHGGREGREVRAPRAEARPAKAEAAPKDAKKTGDKKPRAAKAE